MDLIAKPLEQIIIAITNATNNYGLSIIIFTMLVRLVISPLNLAQLRSAKAMAALSPKLKDLQKVHGKDRETLTKETMKLYQEHKVNPMAGCLPLIIQLPILWGLFNALNTLANPCGSKPGQVCLAHFQSLVGGAAHIHLYHAAFLWLPNLGRPDPIHILPILAGITQWIQSRMMMQPTSDPQQKQMNQIMQFMPLMIVVFAWSYASGLAVYWVCSTIFSIGLQYFVNRDSPTGPWGQLPVLGTGNVPTLASIAGAVRGAAGSTTTPAARPSVAAARPPRAEKAPRPTVISGSAIAQPRGENRTPDKMADGQEPVSGPRPRPRPTRSRPRARK